MNMQLDVGNAKPQISQAQAKPENSEKLPVIQTKKAAPKLPVLMALRDDILSGGTYIEAYKEYYTALQPVIESLDKATKKNEHDPNNPPALRRVIATSSDKLKDIDSGFKKASNAIKKNNFAYSDLEDLNKVFITIGDIVKKAEQNDDLKQVKAEFDPISEQWKKLFEDASPRHKFVIHVLKGISTVNGLDDAIQNLSSTPMNRNTDLALFADQINSVARNVREVGGNIVAYAQTNQFNDDAFFKRVSELPERYQEFAKTISEVAQNPLLKDNKGYIDLISKVNDRAMDIMKFYMPELQVAIANKRLQSSEYHNVNKPNTDDLPTGKYYYSDMVQLKPEIKKQNTEKQIDNPSHGIGTSEKEHKSKNKPKIDDKTLPPVPSSKNTSSNISEKDQLAMMLASGGMPQSALPQGSSSYSVPPHLGSKPSGDAGSDQMINYLRSKSNNPHNLIMPNTYKDAVRPAPLDDKYLRETQGLWDWADYANRMKNKVNAVSNIGQTMEEIALSGTGRPNPEMVSLAKRGRRLKSLNSMMNEVPKINKSTQDLEKAALEAQHSYMTGVNAITTQKLKNEIDVAHMRSEQQKAYQKGIEKLGLDGLEISTNMAKNLTKMVGLFNEIIDMRIENVWNNIKKLARGFKF